MNDVYMYQAALYCAECGEKIRADLDVIGHTPEDPDDETSYDSDDYPKGPFADGGGEADSPQHCDACRVFLENPLTSGGETYVREAIDRAIETNRVDSVALIEWRSFYDIHPSPRFALLERLAPSLRKYADEHGKLPAYTDLGGYPLYYADDEGDVFCPDCVNDPSNTFEPGSVKYSDINYEDAHLMCDGCHEDIAAAYVEPCTPDAPCDECERAETEDAT